MTRLPAPYHNVDRGIYIEIAPRRSGKTRRLISAVVEYLRRDRRNRAYIFCVNRDHVDSLRRSVSDFSTRMSVPDFFERTRIHSYPSFGTMGGTRHPYSFINLSRLPNISLFFDEFEDMDEVPLVDNAWYTSSPVSHGNQSNFFRFMELLGEVRAIERTRVTAQSRRLNAQWTMERANDLRDIMMFGIAPETEMRDALNTERIPTFQRDMNGEWQRLVDALDEDEGTPTTEPPKTNETDMWFYRLGVKI